MVPDSLPSRDVDAANFIKRLHSRNLAVAVHLPWHTTAIEADSYHFPSES